VARPVAHGGRDLTSRVASRTHGNAERMTAAGPAALQQKRLWAVAVCGIALCRFGGLQCDVPLSELGNVLRAPHALLK